MSYMKTQKYNLISKYNEESNTKGFRLYRFLIMHGLWIYSHFSKNISKAKVDKKAMLRNRYNRIPHPAPNTGWESDMYN